MAHRGGNGRPRVSDGEIENVRSLFENNSRLSIRQAESLLSMPRSTIQRVLRKCLFLDPYKMQNLHGITNTDKKKRVVFARHCQNQHEGMSEYLSKIVSSDECIFRLHGSVNTQNVRIWGTQRSAQGRQTFSHSPSIMVFLPGWCACTLFISCENTFGQKEARRLDWKGRASRVATSFTWFDSLWFFSVGPLKRKGIQYSCSLHGRS